MAFRSGALLPEEYMSNRWIKAFKKPRGGTEPWPKKPRIKQTILPFNVVPLIKEIVCIRFVQIYLC